MSESDPFAYSVKERPVAALLKPVCGECGCVSIEAKFYTTWDYSKQTWVLGDQHDGHEYWCPSCNDHYHNMSWVPL